MGSTAEEVNMGRCYLLEEYPVLLVPTTFQPASDLAIAGQTENGEDPRKTTAAFK